MARRRLGILQAARSKEGHDHVVVAPAKEDAGAGERKDRMRAAWDEVADGAYCRGGAPYGHGDRGFDAVLQSRTEDRGTGVMNRAVRILTVASRLSILQILPCVSSKNSPARQQGQLAFQLVTLLDAQ